MSAKKKIVYRQDPDGVFRIKKAEPHNDELLDCAAEVELESHSDSDAKSEVSSVSTTSPPPQVPDPAIVHAPAPSPYPSEASSEENGIPAVPEIISETKAFGFSEMSSQVNDIIAKVNLPFSKSLHLQSYILGVVSMVVFISIKPFLSVVLLQMFELLKKVMILLVVAIVVTGSAMAFSGVNVLEYLLGHLNAYLEQRKSSAPTSPISPNISEAPVIPEVPEITVPEVPVVHETPHRQPRGLAGMRDPREYVGVKERRDSRDREMKEGIATLKKKLTETPKQSKKKLKIGEHHLSVLNDKYRDYLPLTHEVKLTRNTSVGGKSILGTRENYNKFMENAIHSSGGHYE